MPPNPPVSACPRVSVLKTVVLPDPARPTMAICMTRCYPGSRHEPSGGRLRRDPSEIERRRTDVPFRQGRPGSESEIERRRTDVPFRQDPPDSESEIDAC